MADASHASHQKGYAFWPLFSADGRKVCYRVAAAAVTGQTPAELWLSDLASGTSACCPDSS